MLPISFTIHGSGNPDLKQEKNHRKVGNLDIVGKTHYLCHPGNTAYTHIIRTIYIYVILYIYHIHTS